MPNHLFAGSSSPLFLACFYPWTSTLFVFPWRSDWKILPDYGKLGLIAGRQVRGNRFPQRLADIARAGRNWPPLVDSCYQLMPRKDVHWFFATLWQAGAINFYSKNWKGEAFTWIADYLDILGWIWRSPVCTTWFLVWEADERNYLERNWLFSKEYGKSGKITHPLAREKGTTVHFLRGACGY